MNVNCWTFNLLTMAKMFTSFKRREGILLWVGGEYFCDLVCVSACVCVSMPWGRWVNALSFLKTQLALSAKMIKRSFAITLWFILDNSQNKSKAPINIYYYLLCHKWKHNTTIVTNRPEGNYGNKLHCPWKMRPCSIGTENETRWIGCAQVKGK